MRSAAGERAIGSAVGGIAIISAPCAIGFALSRRVHRYGKGFQSQHPQQCPFHASF
jgi:hypothetical protein